MNIFNPTLRYEDEAMLISGFKAGEFQVNIPRPQGYLEFRGLKYYPESRVYDGLKQKFTKYVNPYDKKDKFIPAGFNVETFDLLFLEQMWQRNNDQYFWSFFHHESVDVLRYISMFEYLGLVDRRKGKSLVGVAQQLGIELKEHAHDAFWDILATREIMQAIKKRINNGTKQS